MHSGKTVKQRIQAFGGLRWLVWEPREMWRKVKPKRETPGWEMQTEESGPRLQTGETT